MFGDDPDTAVTTVRVGSGTAFGRSREGFDALCREGFGPRDRIGQLRKRRGEGGWTRWAVKTGLDGEERRENGPATVFGDRKRPCFDRL